MNEIAADASGIAFVGFGEAAQAFLTGWALARPEQVTAFDVKTEDAAERAGMEARYRTRGVSGKAALGEAIGAARLVFCVVTADRALEAARAATGALAPGALWLDCNSCAPDTKRGAAEAIEAAGGRYVDVAVMAPVHPKRHKVPLLISGPHAEAARAAMAALGMEPRIAGAAVGQASSVKMIRSVMVKGLEALTAECFLSARRAGVEDQVIASLEASYPGTDWRARGAYNLERMIVHGARRAAEMREVAATVAALGLPDRMAAATAAWQDAVAATGVEAGEDDLLARLDRILARL